MGILKPDHNKLVLTLTMITLSRFFKIILMFCNFLSTQDHREITNCRIDKYNFAATKEFKRLIEKDRGFSMWNGPHYFVDAETEVNQDGVHFYWPDSIGKVNTVISL